MNAAVVAARKPRGFTLLEVLIVVLIMVLLAGGAAVVMGPFRDRAALDAARSTLRWAGQKARAESLSSGEVLSLVVHSSTDRDLLVLVRTPLEPVEADGLSDQLPQKVVPGESAPWKRTLGVLPSSVRLVDAASALAPDLPIAVPIDDEGFAPPPGLVSAADAESISPRTIAYYFPDGTCAAQRHMVIRAAQADYPVHIARWTGELTLGSPQPLMTPDDADSEVADSPASFGDVLQSPDGETAENEP